MAEEEEMVSPVEYELKRIESVPALIEYFEELRSYYMIPLKRFVEKASKNPEASEILMLANKIIAAFNHYYYNVAEWVKEGKAPQLLILLYKILYEYVRLYRSDLYEKVKDILLEFAYEICTSILLESEEVELEKIRRLVYPYLGMLP